MSTQRNNKFTKETIKSASSDSLITEAQSQLQQAPSPALLDKENKLDNTEQDDFFSTSVIPPFHGNHMKSMSSDATSLAEKVIGIHADLYILQESSRGSSPSATASMDKKKLASEKPPGFSQSSSIEQHIEKHHVRGGSGRTAHKLKLNRHRRFNSMSKEEQELWLLNAR